MKETDELEPQQYQQLYWEENVPVHDVRKSTLRKFVYIGSVVCIVFMLIALFITFPDQVELPFVLKSDRSEEIYRFSDPIYVLEKYVQPGDQIKPDQPLFKITSPEIVTMINDYEEAQQKLLIFNNQKKLSIEKQKQLIAIRIQQNNTTMKQIQQDLSILNTTWQSNSTRLQYDYSNAQKKYDANKNLMDNNIGSKFNLLEAEKNKVAAADLLTSTKQNYEKEKNRLSKLYYTYTLDNNAFHTEWNKLNIDAKYDSATLYNQLTLSKNKIEHIYGRFEIKEGSLIVKANTTGTISYVFEGDKEVAAGSIVLKIIYAHAALYASIDCPPSLIGKIKQHEQVALKITSFPFYEWGTAKGHVSNVSLTPNEKGSFFVKIAIDNFGKLNTLLQVGMNGNATIILEEKTFYEYFFRKVKKLYYKAAMEN